MEFHVYVVGNIALILYSSQEKERIGHYLISCHAANLTAYFINAKVFQLSLKVSWDAYACTDTQTFFPTILISRLTISLYKDCQLFSLHVVTIP